MVTSSPCPWLEVLWVLLRAGKLSPKLLSSEEMKVSEPQRDKQMPEH